MDIKCTASCICCNKTIENNAENNDNTVTYCPNCHMTIVKDILHSKVVANLFMKVDVKMVSYTAFNDANDAFCTTSSWVVGGWFALGLCSSFLCPMYRVRFLLSSLFFLNTKNSNPRNFLNSQLVFGIFFSLTEP